MSDVTSPIDELEAPDLPLAGVRAIDLATGPLAAIGRTLAELGADVVRVEPTQGAADRRQGPSLNGTSLAFATANCGKRLLALNLDKPANRARFEKLLASADILIEACAPDSAEAAALDVAGIRRRHPSLVILSATPFGQHGPYRGWQASGAVLHALSGELSRSGVPGRPPLLPPGDIAHDCAVAQAVYVILLSYMNRLRSGEGDHLDFSLLDAACQALDPGYGIAGSATAGVPASQLPRGRAEARFQYPIIRCADGYVRLCVLAPRQWQGMFEWMGRPEAFADPSYNSLHTRFGCPRLIPAIAEFFSDKTRAQLEEQGQRYGVPTAALLDLDESLASEQARSRQAFVPVDLPGGGRALFPNGQLEIDGRRAGLRGPAPALGADQPCAPAEGARRALPTAEAAQGGAALTGLRVLDLGVIVVGAEQGRLLADQGAEVVKLENAAFPDGSRQTRDGSPLSPTFAAGHRNKKGLGLNLRDPQGKALFLKLAAKSDIILSNFKPGTLESLGLDYPTLSAINPGLIMVDSSAFGPTGPWSRRLGYGPLVRASAGLTAQWRYDDDEESFSDAITVYPDHVAARVGVIGALSLLIRRQRSGRGGTVSVSQMEVMQSHMATRIAARSLELAGRPVIDPAPEHTGVYACAGADEWCAVTIRHDSNWRALCGVIGRADLLADEVLAGAAGRAGERRRVDQALGTWLAGLPPREAMERLQAAGVPAGAMLRVAELPDFPYFRQREFFRLVSHPLIAEPFYLEAGPVRSERLAEPRQGPAPVMGEHTVELMREWLGLPEEEIEALIEAGALEVAEPAAV